jgi:YhcN/YlaJ family sporulation lipoprotein
MKLKLIAAGTALSMALVGCQAGDTGTNTDEGARGTNENRVEQTRYQNNQGDGMTGERDHQMIRDSERNQDRGDMQGQDGQAETRYEVADEAADRITDEVNVIDGAYVLTTENNAYVAANLDTDAGNRENGVTEGGELTEDVKNEISDIVQSVDNDIDNVYVSTNPDFFDLANNYTNDLNDGRPVEGFFSQIGNMLERLFPQNR